MRVMTDQLSKSGNATTEISWAMMTAWPLARRGDPEASGGVDLKDEEDRVARQFQYGGHAEGGRRFSRTVRQ